MKILKPGKVEQRKFTCLKCGCVFVANSNDVHSIREGYKEWRNICFCPTCGENLMWENGEPYEEPARDVQSDKDRLETIIREGMPKAYAYSEFAEYLIANGVTFKRNDMERLTELRYKSQDGFYMKCSEECNVDMDCIDCPAFDKLVDRLGAYEDTGLMPEEVDFANEAAQQLEGLCKLCDLDRLEELVQADKDGRVVVLPAKEATDG